MIGIDQQLQRALPHVNHLILPIPASALQLIVHSIFILDFRRRARTSVQSRPSHDLVLTGKQDTLKPRSIARVSSQLAHLALAETPRHG